MTARLLAAATIMIVVDLAAMHSMAAFVAWGWHLLGLLVIFAALAWWVRDDLPRLSLRTVILLTALVQLTGLVVFPLTSDDIYRYVWDGRVQLAGIDPYRFVPLDPALAGLRDSALFPPGRPPMINRPDVPTLYPPGAQVWFVVVAALTPASWALTVLRLGAAAAVVATTGVVGRWLGPDRGRALLYGANPLIMIEAANAGHLDALVALAVAGVGWSAVRRRHWLAGVLLGLAASVKLVPLLLVPVFLRRGRWRTSLTAVIMTAAGYLPHLLVVGSLVLGYLPGYWAEEGYGGTRRFALLGWVPVQLRTAVAMIAAAVLATVAFLRSAREPVLITCCWLYGASILVATPVYPWYAMPLVVLALMARRPEWLAVWVAGYAAFVFDHSLAAQTISYGLALSTVAWAGWQRSVRYRATAVITEPSRSRRHRLVSDVTAAEQQTD